MNFNKNDTYHKLTLQRKTRSTLNVSNASGKNKQIQIEIRKKLTYINDPVQKVTNNSNDSFSSLNTSKKSLNVSAKKILVNENTQKHNDCGSVLEKEEVLKDLDNKYEKKFLTIVNTALSGDSDHKNNHNNKISQNINIEILKKHAVPNQLGISAFLEEKSVYQKPDNERKNRFFTRVRLSKSKVSSNKLIKQHNRKNFNNKQQRVYNNIIPNYYYSNNEESLQISPYNYRTVKYKRKHSTLLQAFNKPVNAVTRNISLGNTISVSELARKMSIKSSNIIKIMMKLGIIATINQILDQDTAQLIAEEMGHNVILTSSNDLEKTIIKDRNVNLNHNVIYKKRAPIVTIMGHVDHGKTSLLDRIRSTKIASSEVGGITQSIGAYHVNTSNGMITFLDTPGHAAFTAMRVRGIQLTDIVVLVVAADDGIMPQTIEAIKHIKCAKVPVVVAINKIDKFGINIDRIKHDLNSHSLVPEEWGGDTQFVNVSATLGTGINELLDAILLQSEMIELKVLHDAMASAVVIESFLDRGRGPVVNVLIKEGTLKCGDSVLCGTKHGRVRAMYNEFGESIITAGPSIPVGILGISGVPESGDILVVVSDDKKAREVALYRQGKLREAKLSHIQQKEPNIKDVFNSIKTTDNIVTELNLIIKSDTQGSSEAICKALRDLSQNNIIVKILTASIGGITETDVSLAVASNAIILGFNVKSDSSIKRLIIKHQLDVRYYSIIYNLINDINHHMINLITPICKRNILGLVRVRNVFSSPKYGNIAGCIVMEGKIQVHKKIHVIRNNKIIYKGELDSLRRFKQDVHEVCSGAECGIGIKNYNSFCVDDKIEVFDILKESNIS